MLFEYIQKRIKELHEKKSDMEKRLAARERKIKAVDTSPLSEPLAKLGESTVHEKHDVAVTMIEVAMVIQSIYKRIQLLQMQICMPCCFIKIADFKIKFEVCKKRALPKILCKSKSNKVKDGLQGKRD